MRYSALRSDTATFYVAQHRSGVILCIPEMKRTILITGGAGFIGTHLASHFLECGDAVTIFDNLSRRGVRHNLAFLRGTETPGRFTFIEADIRDRGAVRNACADADAIFHLAGQVGVTSSVTDPVHDFEVNAGGTLNVLEGARASGRDPHIVFASTNKVYGDLRQHDTVEADSRYRFSNDAFAVDETSQLDFYSPYGCSKGAGDQYVRDYARIFGLRTTVLRMSCIYGTRQLIIISTSGSD